MRQIWKIPPFPFSLPICPFMPARQTGSRSSFKQKISANKIEIKRTQTNNNNNRTLRPNSSYAVSALLEYPPRTSRHNETNLIAILEQQSHSKSSKQVAYLLDAATMGAPTFPSVGSSRPPQPQSHRDPGVSASHHLRKQNAPAAHEVDQQSLEATYTSLIQEYLQVMCLENATFLAERLVASCQTTNAYYLLGVCHYRSGAPQRALSVLSNNIHQSSSGGSGTKYHDSATAYLMAKCCFDLQQYGRAEETLLGAARADYKEYKSANRSQPNNNYNNKDGNSPMSMDEWLTETTPCPIPNGAAGLYLLGNICRRSNRRRRAMEYYRMSLQVRFRIFLIFFGLIGLTENEILRRIHFLDAENSYFRIFPFCLHKKNACQLM
jgi:hypothetical protein